MTKAVCRISSLSKSIYESVSKKTQVVELCISANNGFNCQEGNTVISVCGLLSCLLF